MANKTSLLAQYAKLAVKMGVNVQKGQLVVIQAPVDAADFTRLLTHEAYQAGAGEVIVNWNDAIISKEHLLNMTADALSKVPDYLCAMNDYYIDNKACFISITSPLLGINKEVDPNKIAVSNKAISEKLKRRREYLMANHGQWTVLAYPNKVWAKKVFPALSAEEAEDKLLSTILDSCRVDEKMTENWNIHNKNLAHYNELLNSYGFESLHFKNSLGTDVVVGLADKHLWAGGMDITSGGIKFNPNLPTEENFTMPHKDRVNGKVVATMPLDYYGKLIEDFYLVFKDGKVVDFDAKKEKETLKNMLSTDEGASRIGEIALIPYDSPISKTGILFYNTLFDENASCHMALGAAYPINTEDGSEISPSELAMRGCNSSTIHVDFMFGSADMTIIGKRHDGTLVRVFENGNYCL